MTHPNGTDPLRDEIRRIVQDFADDRTDRYDFTALDALLARLADQSGLISDTISNALRPLLAEWATGTEKHWQAFRELVSHLHLRSEELITALENVLDDVSYQISPMARYYALSALIAMGGRVSRVKLNREQGIHNQLPSLWLDLATQIYQRAPEMLGRLIQEEIRAERLNWIDIRRRIPTLYNMFGAEFIPLMKDSLLAITNLYEQDKLAAAVDGYYELGFLPWLKQQRRPAQSDPGQADVVAAYDGPAPATICNRYTEEHFDTFVRTGTSG